MQELRKEDAKKAEELIARAVKEKVQLRLPNIVIQSCRFAIFHGATHYRVRPNPIKFGTFEIECNIGPFHSEWDRVIEAIVHSIEQMMYTDNLKKMSDSDIGMEAALIVAGMISGELPAFKAREKMLAVMTIAEKRVS